MRKPIDKWVWFGRPAHFCGAFNCLFHLATDVGDHIVSTVGEYYPRMGKDGAGCVGKMETLGASGHTYETMVFRIAKKNLDPRNCPCGGCILPDHSPSVVDLVVAKSAIEAQANHMKMCFKYGKGGKP